MTTETESEESILARVDELMERMEAIGELKERDRIVARLRGLGFSDLTIDLMITGKEEGE